MEDIAKRINPFKKVRRIDIDPMARFEFTNESLEALSAILKRLSSLQSINIRCYNHELVTDKDLCHLSEALKRIRFLQSISLNFTSSINSTDRGLITLGEVLQKFNSLQAINLQW